MKRILILAIIIGAFNFKGSAQGQNEMQLSLSYNIAIPTTEFADYINIASFRGMNVQLDYYLSDQLAIGASLGWNGFYQKKDRESYDFNGGAVNGVRYNYLYQLPLYLKIQYRLIDEGDITPYAALSAGGIYTEHETYLGYIGFSDDNWTFGTAPEVGALFMLGQTGWEFKASAVYHINFYNMNNLNTIQNLSFGLGFNYDF